MLKRKKCAQKSASWLRSVDTGHKYETSKLWQHNYRNINFICMLTVKNMCVEYLPRSAALLGVSQDQSWFGIGEKIAIFLLNQISKTQRHQWLQCQWCRKWKYVSSRPTRNGEVVSLKGRFEAQMAGARHILLVNNVQVLLLIKMSVEKQIKNVSSIFRRTTMELTCAMRLTALALSRNF